jgi:anti-anti-sigma factor
MTVGFLPVQQPPGRVLADWEAGVRVLRLVGEIDALTVDSVEAEQTRPALAEARRTRTVSVVDLSEVTHLSSTAVGFLLRQTRATRERGDLPILRGLNRHTARVLALTGAWELFQHAA